LIIIPERSGYSTTSRAGLDHTGNVAPLLLCHRRHARQRPTVRPDEVGYVADREDHCVPRNRAVRFDLDCPVPARSEPKPLRRRRRRYAGAPKYVCASETLAPRDHTVRIHLIHLHAGANLNAQPLQLPPRVTNQPVREARQQVGPALEQDHPSLRRMDVAELTRQGDGGQFPDRPGQLHP
jgi:hypothetical protein